MLIFIAFWMLTGFNSDGIITSAMSFLGLRKWPTPVRQPQQDGKFAMLSVHA